MLYYTRKTIAVLSGNKSNSNLSLTLQVPLEEPVNITQKVAIKGVLVPGSTEDVLSQGFSNLGMSREKIENAQQV